MTWTTVIVFVSFVLPLLGFIAWGAWLTLTGWDHKIPAPWDDER